MEGCGRAAEFGRFCCGKLRNFASWPAEFGNFLRGKLWALVIGHVTICFPIGHWWSSGTNPLSLNGFRDIQWQM